MTAALQGGEWSAARPGRTLPRVKTQYTFYRRLGGPQGRYGRAENLVPTGIQTRIFQPVAQSLYRLRYPVHIILTVLNLKEPTILRHPVKFTPANQRFHHYVSKQNDTSYLHRQSYDKPLFSIINKMYANFQSHTAFII